MVWFRRRQWIPVVKVASSIPQAPRRVQLIGRGGTAGGAVVIGQTHASNIPPPHLWLSFSYCSSSSWKEAVTPAAVAGAKQWKEISVQRCNRPIGPDIDKTDSQIGPGCRHLSVSRKKNNNNVQLEYRMFCLLPPHSWTRLIMVWFGLLHL